jgi:hypothetical protein
MEDEILVFAIIEKHHIDGDGMCGCTINKIMAETSKTYSDLKPILNNLFVAKKIKTRQGINGKLIFLYDKNRVKKVH